MKALFFSLALIVLSEYIRAQNEYNPNQNPIQQVEYTESTIQEVADNQYFNNRSNIQTDNRAVQVQQQYNINDRGNIQIQQYRASSNSNAIENAGVWRFQPSYSGGGTKLKSQGKAAKWVKKTQRKIHNSYHKNFKNKSRKLSPKRFIKCVGF